MVFILIVITDGCRRRSSDNADGEPKVVYLDLVLLCYSVCRIVLRLASLLLLISLYIGQPDIQRHEHDESTSIDLLYMSMLNQITKLE